MKYTIKLNGSIKLETDNGDVLYIPADIENRHYKKYLEWVNAGNTPDQEQPVVPTEAELKTQARRKAESHITTYFSPLELMDMLKRLGTSPNAHLIAINEWIENVQNEALTNYQNPNFNKFGNPPFLYEEIV